MVWGWEIFYGLATATALGLSWKQGGPVSVAASLIAAMWLFQGVLYWFSVPFVGNMMGSAINAVLILLISTMPARTWNLVVVSSLLTQLFAHVWFRQGSLPEAEYRITINVLYLAQLIALGWSGGKRVLDGLGAWLADIWSRGYIVAILDGQTGGVNGPGNRRTDGHSRSFGASDTFGTDSL